MRAPARSRPRASPRTAARSSAATCSWRCRGPRPTAWPTPRRRPRPAPRRSSARAARPRCRRARCSSRSRTPGGRWRLLAARIYPRQPKVIAAVTGTSGKTSVAAFTRQIWAALGHEAASVGTIGVVTAKREVYGSLTTPDPVDLHRTLSELAGEGVTHLAIEASSHGLDQHRLDGVRVAAGGFTNLSRDHLDYHPSVEAYLAAKLRLFESLVADGGGAVIDVDHEHSDAVVAAAKKRGLKLITVGRNGDGIRLVDTAIDGFTQAVSVEHAGKTSSIPAAAGRRLPGRERAGGGGSRALRPAARRIACSRRWLRSRAPRDGSIWSATATARRCSSTTRTSRTRWRRRIEALRPYVKRQLVVVFGAGGDRDKGKRAVDGRHRRQARRPRHRHRRQSAQRKSRRDPRRHHGGRVPRAERARDRRPPRGDPRRRGRARAGRRAADRRQGPRDRADRRRARPWTSATTRKSKPRCGRRSHEREAREGHERRCGRSRPWRRRWARTPQGALPQSVPGLSIDTRTIQRGRGVLRAQGCARRP